MSVTGEYQPRRYVGDGSTVIFSFPFRIFDASDITVYVDGVEVQQGVAYTVKSAIMLPDNSGYDWTYGGYVQMSSPTYVPESGQSVIIHRIIAIKQPLDLEEGGSLPPQALETAFDLLTLIAQQTKYETLRAARLSIVNADTMNTEIPLAVAGAVLGITEDGTGFKFYDEYLMKIQFSPDLTNWYDESLESRNDRYVRLSIDGGTTYSSPIDLNGLQNSLMQTTLTYKNQAAASATAAASSASAAAVSASNAATSATNALASATSAASSASSAQSAKTSAEAARDAAITARTGAEAAKTAAETAQSGAVTAKNEADSAKVLAESARDAAISAKTLAETAKTGADSAATAANAAKTDAQAAKTASEAARDKSQKWAEENKGVEVETGKYSAKHWAQTASDTLSSKAPINSPVFTGTPKAPTLDAADNSEGIATTAHVKMQVASETVAGMTRYATSAEVIAGTATNKSVTPAGNKAALDRRILLMGGVPA